MYVNCKTLCYNDDVDDYDDDVIAAKQSIFILFSFVDNVFVCVVSIVVYDDDDNDERRKCK